MRGTGDGIWATRLGGLGENGANKVGNGTRHKMEMSGLRGPGRAKGKLLTERETGPGGGREARGRRRGGAENGDGGGSR